VVLALAAASARGQQPSPAISSASINIAIDAPDVAVVNVNLSADRPMAPVAWQFLHDRCAGIDTVLFTQANTTQAVLPSSRGPWTTVPAPDMSTPTATLRYRVHMFGPVAAIPIVMPAAPLGDRGAAAVRLRLTIGSRLAHARPLFPALHQVGAGEWEAQFPAMPSVVRIALNDSVVASCAGEEAPASAGPFLPIFFSFVAVLVLWVPLYLWWARRSRDSRA
jgi:hypothetical protein